MSRTTAKRNRVLMLVENNPYPNDIRVRLESLALRDAGYDVTVISPATARERWRAVVDGVDVYRFPACRAGRGFLGYAWEYAYSTTIMFLLSLWVSARKGLDVIHAANPPDTLVVIGAFHKLFGKRFIFDQHDLCPEMYCAAFGGKRDNFAYRVLMWFEHLSYTVADHVIATNRSYARIAMERGRVPQQHVTVVRNGPELGTVNVEPDSSFRHAGKINIAYAGTIGHQDGLDHLLRVLQYLSHDLGRTDFCCSIFGGGRILDSLKALAKQLGIDKFVTFTGWVQEDKVLRYLAGADICVDPDPSNAYNDRSTMIKIGEYMALGKPIVGFDLPENRYTAQDSAIFVRPNDEIEFAKALAQLMDDPARRQQMGAFGRRRVETDLAWLHSVPPLLSAYRMVLERR